MLPRFLRIVGWVWLGLCCIVPALASSPYSQVTLPVADRSPAEFQQAVAVGYAEAMKRLSGNPAVMTTPAVQSSAATAASYVSQYSYIEQASQDPSARQLLLQLTFNEHALVKVLQDAGQSLLGKQRPLTLVVMLNDQNGVLNFFSASDAQTLGVTLSQVAQQHGLPIVLPLGDLEDQTLLSANAVPSISSQAGDAMRNRYQVSNLLVGVVVPLGDRVQIQWQLWSGERYFQWTAAGADVATVIGSSFDRLLETIANQYAVVKTSKLNDDVMVAISGVYGLPEHVAVLRLFKQLTPVSRVAVREMTPDTLRLSVTVSGGAEALQRALQFDKSLIPAQPKMDEESTAALFFDWRGVASAEPEDAPMIRDNA